MGVVRVTPEELESQAGQVTSQAEQVNDALSTLQSQVSDLMSRWEGAGSTAFNDLFNETTCSTSGGAARSRSTWPCPASPPCSTRARPPDLSAGVVGARAAAQAAADFLDGWREGREKIADALEVARNQADEAADAMAGADAAVVRAAGN